MNKDLWIAAITAAVLTTGMQVVEADDKTMSNSPTASATRKNDRELIASAMQAAPKKVASNATIVVAESDGKMRTLREGSNGFTCMPDNPTTPGPDPMCMDKAALAWIDAREFAADHGIANPARFFEQHGLGLSDGADFGAPGFVRLNFGTRRALLEEALARMAQAVSV